MAMPHCPAGPLQQPAHAPRLPFQPALLRFKHFKLVERSHHQPNLFFAVDDLLPMPPFVLSKILGSPFLLTRARPARVAGAVGQAESALLACWKLPITVTLPDDKR